MTVSILRIDGTTEHHEMSQAECWDRLRQLLQASSFDTVNLRDGRVMIVDDDGYEVELIDHGMQRAPHGGMAQTWERRPTTAKKPVNAEATKLYHAVCKPGVTHQIVGDVAIVWDQEFA